MSRGTVVLLHGHIKGMNCEAECEVLARRLTGPSGDPRVSTYSDCAVVGAPSDLPDGEYAVEFAGYTFAATRRHDLWLTSGPASKIEELPRVFEI